MIVQIFVAQRDRVRALPQQIQRIVIAASLTPRIGKRFGNRLPLCQEAIGMPEQQRTAIRGDVAAIKTGLSDAAINAWKLQKSLVTFGHGDSVLYSSLAL